MYKLLSLTFSPAKALILAGVLAPLFCFAQPKVQLSNFASGFDLPVDIDHCGDSRLFVVERDGVIWVLDSLGNRLDTFLNIDPRVNSTQNEQGLLGLAFDPNYASNGYFYVDYTKNSTGNTRVARFSVKPDNPNEADPNSEVTILEQAQPNWNHNGGCLKFGPDGYLYISFGDGGGANDPTNYGQNKKTFLGKILRIDVRNSSASAPYVVPADNPFVGNADYYPEIWSLGWRNPWRFSFDRVTGDMWIGDVGQNLWEEVDFEPANTPGLNYGWRCYEGTHAFNTNNCLPSSDYVAPFFDYAHSGANGCSVTGGFIYRGSKYPDLYGCYLFADYCSGRWWYTRRNADGTFSTNILSNFGGYEFSTFGEDRDGELYVALLSSGKVQKIKELCSAFQVSVANITDQSCPGAQSGAIALSATGATGNVSYTWSNGQTGPAVQSLNPGIYTVEVKDGNNCIRRDTFEIANAGPAIPALSASDTVLCPGSAVVLTANNLTPPAYMSWYNGSNLLGLYISNETMFMLSAITPGTYSFVLSDSLCTLSSPLVSVIADPTQVPVLSASGDTIFVTPACNNCTWLRNGQPILGTNGDYLVAPASGTYQLQITSPYGCQLFSNQVELEISNTQLPASVKRFTLLPNPTEQLIWVEMDLEVPGGAILSLSDSSQRRVYNKAVQGQKINLSIDMSDLPKGTYFLTVQTYNGDFVKKVIKK